jgi:hypothetical protein
MVGVRDFAFYHNFQTDSGAHPAPYPVDTRRWLFLWDKMAEHETGHSHPLCAKVNPSLQFSVDITAGI